MTLYYPGYDPASFALGAISQQSLAVQWRMYLNPAWYLQADWQHQTTTMAQSPDVTLTSGGVAGGVAFQPRVTMLDTPLMLSIGYQF